MLLMRRFLKARLPQITRIIAPKGRNSAFSRPTCSARKPSSGGITKSPEYPTKDTIADAVLGDTSLLLPAFDMAMGNTGDSQIPMNT